MAKQLALLGAMFQLAVDDERLPHNPVARIRVAVAKTGKPPRRPFTVGELNPFFASPIYRRWRRCPRGSGGMAAYWMPLIGLYAGMRLEEIAQLQRSDIREEAGVAYFNVDDADEGQRLKTASSRRRIPVHGVLVGLGLLDYVAWQRLMGEHRLFPDLRADRKGKLSGNWSKWFGRYLCREVKLGDPRNPLTGVTVSGALKHTSEREPFTHGDMRRIFASPVFTKSERPCGGAGEAAYWLPVLALYTGARLEELGQLACSDVQNSGGILYVDITTASHDTYVDEDGATEGADSDASVERSRRSGRKRLKTESSRRRIPLHPRLLDLGFIACVDALRKSGETRVFPQLRPESPRVLRRLFLSRK